MRLTKCFIAAIVLFVAIMPLMGQDETRLRQLTGAPSSEHPLMPIGTSAPDFSLKGTDDKVHTLAEFSHAKVLFVMFESIHCTVSENYEGRLHQLYDTYHDRAVGLRGH
ncbi:MAG: redoxin domain-containing protein [Bryobacteraceae bacterium]